MRKRSAFAGSQLLKSKGVEGELMSMKKFGLAAVMMLLAVSAMASNFRAADQVYLPAAGKIGSFASDVYVSNPNSFAVTVSVIYSTTTGGTQTRSEEHTSELQS